MSKMIFVHIGFNVCHSSSCQCFFTIITISIFCLHWLQCLSSSSFKYFTILIKCFFSHNNSKCFSILIEHIKHSNNCLQLEPFLNRITQNSKPLKKSFSLFWHLAYYSLRRYLDIWILLCVQNVQIWYLDSCSSVSISPLKSSET